MINDVNRSISDTEMRTCLNKQQPLHISRYQACVCVCVCACVCVCVCQWGIRLTNMKMSDTTQHFLLLSVFNNIEVVFAFLLQSSKNAALMYASFTVHRLSVCVCVCVCVGERERERKTSLCYLLSRLYPLPGCFKLCVAIINHSVCMAPASTLSLIV